LLWELNESTESLALGRLISSLLKDGNRKKRSKALAVSRSLISYCRLRRILLSLEHNEFTWVCFQFLDSDSVGHFWLQIHLNRRKCQKDVTSLRAKTETEYGWVTSFNTNIYEFSYSAYRGCYSEALMIPPRHRCGCIE